MEKFGVVHKSGVFKIFCNIHAKGDHAAPQTAICWYETDVTKNGKLVDIECLKCAQSRGIESLNPFETPEGDLQYDC